MQAWRDAAARVDDKWELALAQTERVHRGFAKLLDDDRGDYALGASTHDLIVRLLSALPLSTRRRLVTTDGEFHTVRRQLDRLGEEGIDVVKVPHAPAASVTERLVQAIDDRTAAAIVSAVFYANAHIVSGLGLVMRRCQEVGAELLVDAYHALNVIPFTISSEGLDDAFIVGGGYKYCQLGEGNCFLRVPPGSTLRPVTTGWFAEFDALSTPDAEGRVSYAAGGSRFAGATYGATSHY